MEYSRNISLFHRLRFTLALLASFVFSQLGFAQVVTMSPDKFVQVGENEAYWEVAVECVSGIKPTRIIRQNHNESRWCAKEFSELCSSDKSSASQLICGDEHSARINSENQKRLQEQQQRQLVEKRRQDAEAKLREQEAARIAEQRKAQQERTKELARQQQADAQAEDELIDIEQQLLQVQTAQLENRKKLRAIRKELSRR